MMNNVVIVGRLSGEPEIKELGDSGKKQTIINLNVTRNYKNIDGKYETDKVRCVLWNAIATSTCEYCHDGDVVGIKGRIESYEHENENGSLENKQWVVAEKITFLNSNKDKDKEK